MYFENLPDIFYAFEIEGRLVLKTVKDITANVRPLKRILEEIVYYEDYDIEGDDTPEIIAERLYGDPQLHWVLMLINEKYNYLEDWPIPDWKLSEYVTKKYGAGNEYATHQIYGRQHWVSPTGRIVDSTYPLAAAVSNLQYEQDLNEKKRRIRIVNPKLIGTFIANLTEAFSGE